MTAEDTQAPPHGGGAAPAEAPARHASRPRVSSFELPRLEQPWQPATAEPERPLVAGSPGIDDDLTTWIAAEERAARVNPRRMLLIRRGAGVGGALLALMGTGVLIGWATGNETATRVLPGLVTRKWWTAACFIALGVGIAAPTVWDVPPLRRLSFWIGVLVAALATTFLLEYVTGADFGHDNVFGLDSADGDGHPGRMAQSTALSFILLGLALSLLKAGRIRAAQAIAVLPVAFGFLAVLGYTLGVSSLYSWVAFASMALHTGIGCMLAGLALLGLRPDRGFMRTVSGNTAGGRLARRMLPLVLVVPPTLAWIALTLEERSEVDTAFALAMVATAVSLLGAMSIWWEASSMRTVDLRRAGTEAALRRVRRAEAQQAELAADLRETNRRIQGILDSAVDAFVGLDEHGVITSWNPAAQRLYGCSDAEAVGARLDELLVVYLPDGTRMDRRVDADFLRAAIERGPVGYSVVRKDGTIAEVESRVWAQQTKDGPRYTALVRDEAQRRIAERELHELNRSLDEFATVAAHDLRGPFTAIRGFVELLEDEATKRGDTAGLAIVQRINGATDRGVQLIDDLLAYSRAGRGPIQPARVDTAALVRALGHELHGRTGSGCCVQVGDLPAVSGDEGALRQVLANLLENAVRYCPEDRCPRVVVASDDDDQTLVRLMVTDNGAGIPEAERERIFEMFQRGTTGQGRQGTGVGLAFCRRVVERHGGTIWVEPGPEGGSRFVLTLPRHFDGPEATPPATA